MKIEGEHRFEGITCDQAWTLFTDPDILKRCMPGCERLEPVGDGAFAVDLFAGVASVKGRYTGTIRLDDRTPPSHFKINIEGKGTSGFLKGSGVFDLLEERDGMRVKYSGDVQIGGIVASVGQRMLQGVAKMMIGQFFSALEVEASAIVEAQKKTEPAAVPQHGIIRDAVRYVWKRRHKLRF